MAYEAKPNTGSLFKNDRKEVDRQPDYTGTWKDSDGKEWQLAAWIKEGKKGKYMSLSASEKRTQTTTNSTEGSGSSDLPF
jgi:hypothetical protein